MKYLPYLIGGAVCAGGSACAVAVPVSLSSGGRISRPSISRCSTSSTGQDVNFGDQGAANVCWKLTSDSDQEEEGQEEELSEEVNSTSESQLTSLLQQIWGNETALSSGEELSVGWKSSCVEGKWKLSESSDGEKVWGYCNGTSSEDNNFPFLELSNQTSNSQKFRVCFQGKKCWTDPSGGEGVATLSAKDSGEWKSLKFQKK